MSGDWTLLASSALTNKPIDELPMTGVTLSRALNDSGTLEGDVPLDASSVLEAALHPGATEPAAIAIYAARDGVYRWGGILWKHEYDSSTGKLHVTANEHGSYGAFRYVVAQQTFSGDMATVVQNWVTAAFGDNGPALLTNVQLTGTNISSAFNSYEQHQLLELLKTYQQQQGGYDWAFDVGIDGNGNPAPQLTLSFPHRGTSYRSNGLVFDYPGSVTTFRLTKDGSRFVSDLYVNGAGSGTTQVQEHVSGALGGHLKMQRVDNNRDLLQPAPALAYAQDQLNAFGGQPPITMTAKIDGPAAFAQPFTVGDELIMSFAPPDAQGRVQVPYFPAGADVPQRVLGYKVYLPTDSTKEYVELTLGATF